MMTLGTTHDLAVLRTLVLDAYHRSWAQSPGFSERVAWYERVVLLRKVHFFAGQEDGEKWAQAVVLLRLLHTHTTHGSPRSPASRRSSHSAAGVSPPS